MEHQKISFWLKIKKTIRRSINYLLSETNNHFICFLPKNLGFSSRFLKKFYSRITLKDEQLDKIKNMPENSIKIYATKHKSTFEYLFYHSRYEAEDVSIPEIAFDYKIVLWQPISRLFKILLSYIDYFFSYFQINNPYKSGYVVNELISGKTALLSLIEKKGFYRRFVKSKADPLLYLVTMQKDIDRPIFIIPQLMMYSKKPQRTNTSIGDIIFGSEEKPGKIKRLITLFNHPNEIFVEVSEPFSLQQFLKLPENYALSPEQQAIKIRRQLLVQINRHKQSIIGPILKSRVEVKENILTNPKVQEFFVDFAKTNNIPIRQVQKRADAYLDEIASNYSSKMIKLYDIVITWILKHMFEGLSLNYEVLSKVKNASLKAPLILAPCHKSHLDYLMLSYVFFKNNLPCPHIAAGKNLSFWPLGPIFRGGGAFFLRRTFKGDELYAKIFAEYVQNLILEGFNIEFFIEGGRSRTGKILMPKLGFLSLILNAYTNKVCNDLMFVPVFVSYDRVIEESAYLHEIEGGQKEPESFMQVLKARKFIRKRYGKIYIMFDEPFSLNEYLANNNIDIFNLSKEELKPTLQNLGFRLTYSINKVSIVTPHALVAAALLNIDKKRFSYDKFVELIDTYITFLISQDSKLADSLFADKDGAIKQTIESFIQSKFIEKIPNTSEDESSSISTLAYKINENKRGSLDYYKNGCIVLLIPAAMTAMSILEKDAFQFVSQDIYKSYGFLQNFFQYEFTYDPDKNSSYYVEKTIKSFVDDAILMPHQTIPDMYNITSSGFRKLKVFATFLKTYLESYFVVLNFFAKYPKNIVDEKNRINKIQTLGKRMYNKKEIERRESFSKFAYKNAMDFFIEHEVTSSDDKEKIDYYLTKMKKYMNCLTS
ncbi:MAG: 1-acyl-sn-glycerol-3-phosphate acyltransferase [Desulfobacterales bacterium]|nr:1-acyl-sn-glycerol-3-phosphate acyltransferase [Desulfobacterales bacterium]